MKETELRDAIKERCCGKQATTPFRVNFVWRQRLYIKKVCRKPAQMMRLFYPDPDLMVRIIIRI
jgi:hypothetical protein